MFLPHVPLTAHEVEVLSTLDPAFRPYCLALRAKMAEQGVSTPLQSGYRPWGYQDLLYRHPEFHPGTPAAPPGGSKHERGFACDYDLSKIGKLDVVKFGMAAEALGLIWGGRFKDSAGKPTPDEPHVESPLTNQQLDIYRAVTAWGQL